MEPKLHGIARLDMADIFKANRDSQTCIKATFDNFWTLWKTRMVAQQVKGGVDHANADASLEHLRGPVYAGYLAGVSIVQSVARAALCGSTEATLDALAIFAEYDTTTSTLYAQAVVNKASQPAEGAKA